MSTDANFVARPPQDDGAIVIVGMACRGPGCDGPEELWGLLDQRRDAITTIEVEGAAPVPCGAIQTVDTFDAGFFRVSPREAERMDARQRLALEVGWEALESARLSIVALSETPVGVYVGASGTGVAPLLFATSSATDTAAGYDVTGTLPGVIAGRVSYSLGLRGPSMTVDTTCSSALVALHLACRALRAGECDVALAGGVCVVPRTARELASWSALMRLSKLGRCAPFDASADGVVGSDGCGMVVLKRLGDAKSAEDAVLGIIRGSAVNHDGRTQGLTVPSRVAQEEVIRGALADARLSPNEIDYVECHATATPLGDPIEVDALGNALGAGRTRPLVLGALKSNIGHTGAAAGIMGIIKAVLALDRETIPGNPHFTTPSPHIAWSSLPVRVSGEPVAWPRGSRRRIAGVSAFGLSGTNAHVVIEEAPVAESRHSRAAQRPAELIVLSARSEAALREVASRLEAHVRADEEAPLADLAFSLSTTRTHHDVRLAVPVSARSSLLTALAIAARGETPPGGARGTPSSASRTIAWLLPGQGSQVVGMARDLWDAWPVFREALDRALAALDPHLSAPLRDVMWSDGERLVETEFTQPAMFALSVALGALWRSWGVKPAIVAGHSVGEICAAHLAGVFSLEDASRLVATRARLMQSMPRGAMVSLGASEALVRDAIEKSGSNVSIAAVNAAESVVVSGTGSSVFALVERLTPHGVRATRLAVSHAFHSLHVDAIAEGLRRAAHSLSYRAPEIPVVSNVSGDIAGAEIATAEYWVAHARAAVRFSDGARTLRAAGVTHYVELGAKPTLLALVADAGRKETRVASLRPGRTETEAIVEALGRLHADGVEIDWKGVCAPHARHVALPTYPWQRQRYWYDTPASPPRSEATRQGLLGARVESEGATITYETVLLRGSPRWLIDHEVAGEVLVPGAAIAEMIRAAAENVLGGPVEITDLALPAALVLLENEGRRVQVRVEDLDEGRACVTVHGRSPSAEWTLHGAANAARSPGAVPAPADLASVRTRCATPVDVEEAYRRVAASGLTYGPSFRGVRALWRGAREALAELELPGHVEDAEQYGVHPALLDAALHSALLALRSDDELRVPFGIERLTLYVARLPRSVVAPVRVSHESADEVSVDLTLMDAQGRTLADVVGVRTRRFARATSNAARTATEALYRLGWKSAEPTTGPSLPPGKWVIIAEASSRSSEMLVARLRDAGATCTRVERDGLAGALPAENIVCVFENPVVDDPSGARRLASEGLSLVQALTHSMTPARVWWVTRRAVSVLPPAERPSLEPAAAALRGLGRSVMQEHPDLACTLVDLDASGTELEVDALLQELRVNDGEREVARRAEHRFVARLERASPLEAPDGENYALETFSKGMLDSLSLVEAVRRPPARGEVEIAVLASGLNFRDVLNALGMFPGDAGPLGNECAGVVVRVGAEVDRVAPGDTVMAFGSGMFRRYVTVDARQVVAKPSNLSWEEAAGTPLAFLTAWYALRDLANLRRGERIVVHAAAGGVGMAAVQIAHMLGVEVLATASPSKWDALRALGVTRLASSRDVTFAREFGPTAHVVLNALSGEFVDASLSVLTKGGRFLEMGKTDVRDPKVVAASHPGVHYRAFDLSEAGLDRIAQMLDAIAEALCTGALRPLPLTRFAVTEAEAAFRFMAQARHVGKIVLTALRDEHGFRRDGTVVVTGGLGALGLHVARWLVERGVKHLLLLGRRGMATPGAAAAVAELTARGASVRVEAVDVADRHALVRAIREVDPHAPLRGVVHAAGVLDDGVLSDQTPERFARVLTAKTDGARNLDAATRGADLDFFVLFSSIAGTLGSAGQGAYAAANAFLDALAWRRRAEGHNAQSLAWGPWSGGGMASMLTSPSQQDRLARRGVLPLMPAQGLALFASALARPEPALVVAALDLDAVSHAFDVEVPHIWRELVHPRDARSSEPATEWLSELRTLPPMQQLPAVLDAVRTEIARVLSLGSARDVRDDQLLSDLGLDSLMAVELRNALARRVGASLHATLAFDYPTAIAISEYLVQRVLVLEPTAETTKASRELDVTPPSHGDRVAGILAEIAALTEREQQTLADALFERGS